MLEVSVASRGGSTSLGGPLETGRVVRESITHAYPVLSLSKKFTHDCYWQQDTDLDRHLLWINMDSLKRDAANKLSYKSKAGRAQQLLGFKSEHLTKNSRRLKENSVATSAASLLPVFLFFISTSTIHHLPNFFLHLIIASILRCITQEDTCMKQHNIIIWFCSWALLCPPKAQYWLGRIY